MVWGSLVSALIPIPPLIDCYITIFSVPAGTGLESFSEAQTWIFLILSGLFFTVGSWVFLRAFEEPPPPPLFPNFYHFQTDELFASWLFLFAMLPSIPFSLIFVANFPHELIHWGALIASILFCGASAFFTWSCYPFNHVLGEEKKTDTQIVLKWTSRVFGEKSFLLPHCQTDWLASTWFMLIATLFWFFGSWLMLFTTQNDRQLFVYSTSFVDSLLFLIGCCYYTAGSYPPHATHSTMDHDSLVEKATHVDDGSIMSWINSPNKTRSRSGSEIVYNPLQLQADEVMSSQNLPSVPEDEEEGEQSL